MKYESEIELLPDGSGTLITRESEKEKNRDHEGIDRYPFTSPESLRKTLLREKFDFNNERWGMWGFWLGGAVLITCSIANINPLGFSNSRETGLAGIYLATYGTMIMYHSKSLEGVSSRIQAFHDKFPDLQPIRLGLREYRDCLFRR